jgi:hypothetical protein
MSWMLIRLQLYGWMRKQPEPLVNTVLIELAQYGHGML